MAHLRRAVEAIEARSGTAEPRAGARLSLGRALDRRLSGGLALDALHEIAPAAPADGPAATGFALSLAARCLAERRSAGLIVVEDFAERDMGALYGPGLVAHGLDLAPPRVRARARRAGAVPGDGGRACAAARRPSCSARSGG